MSSMFTLCNSAVGAGVLSLPYAFSCAGLVGCLLLSGLLASAEAFTLYVLAKFAERYSAPSYGNLVHRALGKKLAAALSAILLVYEWGSCVAYLVIIGDTFSSLGRQHFGAESLLGDRHAIIVGVGTLILWPLCFPRSLNALEYISATAVAGFIYSSAAILTRGVQITMEREPHFEGVKLFGSSLAGMMYAIPIIVFGFNSHANVVSIFHELDQYPHRLISPLPPSPRSYHSLPLAPRPTTYKLVGMLGVIIAGMLTIFCGYMSVGVAGYLAYPGGVASNILNTFPPEDLLIQGARAAIGFVVIGHYPINHHPSRAAWEDLAATVLGVHSMPAWLSYSLTTAFVGSTMFTALEVTDLGSVLHLIGGTAASFMIFFLPGMLLLNAAIIKEANSFSNLADMDTDYEAPLEDSASVAASGSTPLLLHKKAGIRESGLIYSPSKSWWCGMLLVCLSIAVLLITMITVLVGPPQ